MNAPKLARALISFPYYSIRKGQVRAIKYSSDTFCYIRLNKRTNLWTILPTIYFKELSTGEQT